MEYPIFGYFYHIAWPQRADTQHILFSIYTKLLHNHQLAVVLSVHLQTHFIVNFIVSKHDVIFVDDVPVPPYHKLKEHLDDNISLILYLDNNKN